MSIPIENIYYLLCYAWDYIGCGPVVDLSSVKGKRVVDLLGKVLISGLTALIQRGMDREYDELSMELTTVRGRIDLNWSAKRALPPRGRLHCVFDELQFDVLPNRLLKAAAMRLVRTDSLDPALRSMLVGLARRMSEVTDVELRPEAFGRVRLHGNNRSYRFLLNVCELVAHSTMPEQRTGRYRFLDFLQDAGQMPLLFQHFVRNFYRLESGYSVKGDNISWDAEAFDGSRAGDLDALPRMTTDITLRSPGRTIVIDTKFHQECMQSHFEGFLKVKSENLYQLHAYLTNLEAAPWPDSIAEGILLYPVVESRVDLLFRIRGHVVRVYAVNLAQPWEAIEEELLSLVECPAVQPISKPSDLRASAD